MLCLWHPSAESVSKNKFCCGNVWSVAGLRWAQANCKVVTLRETRSGCTPWAQANCEVATLTETRSGCTPNRTIIGEVERRSRTTVHVHCEVIQQSASTDGNTPSRQKRDISTVMVTAMSFQTVAALASIRHRLSCGCTHRIAVQWCTRRGRCRFGATVAAATRTKQQCQDRNNESPTPYLFGIDHIRCLS
jgi:hypothetical protein